LGGGGPEKIAGGGMCPSGGGCKGNLTILRRILYLDLAKGNSKRRL
jgi:hypothetical protein